MRLWLKLLGPWTWAWKLWHVKVLLFCWLEWLLSCGWMDILYFTKRNRNILSLFNIRLIRIVEGCKCFPNSLWKSSPRAGLDPIVTICNFNFHCKKDLKLIYEVWPNPKIPFWLLEQDSFHSRLPGWLCSVYNRQKFNNFSSTQDLSSFEQSKETRNKRV